MTPDQFRSIVVTGHVAGHYVHLEGRLGRRPTTVEFVDVGEQSPVQRPASVPQAQDAARRLALAASEVLASSPAEFSDLALNLDTGEVSGGCWWRSFDGGDFRRDFKAATCEKIAARMAELS